MTSSPLLLVTGPIGRANEYVSAAKRAGWTAQACELLEIRPRALDLEQLPETVDLICVTSKHAAGALKTLPLHFRKLPVAAVGSQTTKQVRKAGFKSTHKPSRNAAELVANMSAELPPNSKILWPRGSLSDELAQDLREAGFEVWDPISYETAPIEASDDDPDLSSVTAVFLASPSAVQVFLDRYPNTESTARIDAIAIGSTTADALMEFETRFRSMHSLYAPNPVELTKQLLAFSSPTGS